MRFCRENLHVKSTEGWSIQNVVAGSNIFAADLYKNNEKQNHTLYITNINNSGFHVRVEMDKKLSSYRYDIYHDNLIVNKTKIENIDNIEVYNIDQTYYIGNKEIILEITPSPLQIRLLKAGKEYINIVADEFMIIEDGSAADSENFDNHVETVPNGKTSVGLSFAFPKESKISGFLEENTALNLDDIKESRRYARDGFSLYGNVPFFIAHHNTLDSTPGVFWMNPSDLFFSIRTEEARKGKNGIDGNRIVRVLSEGGFINFVLFADSLPNVMKQYTHITGLPDMPPAWTLGYQQSKWGYESQKIVEEVHKNLTENEIPHDVTWLDIDHLNSSTPFTMSSDWFYDADKMFKTAEDEHRAIIKITDPHMKVSDDFAPYKEAMENDYFVKYNDNVFYDNCWPGNSSWPDFLREDVRNWWASKFTKENGFPSSVFVWNDMNEPSAWTSMEATFPKDSKQLNGKVESREVKSIYGLAMTAATHKGLSERGNRTFLLTRSFFAGSQKYAWHWSGDNTADYSYLRESIDTLLTANLNGMYFTGSDVGGFFGNSTADLIARWFQAGSLLYPLFREHSEFESNHREPYVFIESNPKEYQAIKSAIIERYELLPHLYKTAERTVRAAEPFVAPVWYYHPYNMSHDINYQPIVGRDLMVCPLLTNKTETVKVVKPPGRWFFYRTGKELTDQETKVNAWITDNVPAFTRGGSIIGKFTKTALTVYDTFQQNITLLISVDSNYEASGYLYFDDLISHDYKEGKFMNVTVDFSKKKFKITVDGGLKQNVICDKIIVYGLNKKVEFHGIDGKFRDGVLFVDDLKIKLYENRTWYPEYYYTIVYVSVAVVGVVILIVLIFYCLKKRPESGHDDYEAIGPSKKYKFIS